MINCIEWKEDVCSKENRKTESSRLYSNNKEKDRGPQFTRGVSPQYNTVLGKQITAGQLTNIERMKLHIYDMMITMIFNWALRQNT